MANCLRARGLSPWTCDKSSRASGHARQTCSEVRTHWYSMTCNVTASALFNKSNCRHPLGLTNGYISESSKQIRGSCGFATLLSARLNTNVKPGAWCAQASYDSQYLQVDFLKPTTITSVSTQGEADGGRWVRSYKLNCSTDVAGRHWTIYMEGGRERRFVANSDADSVVKNDLQDPMTCWSVQLLSFTYRTAPCLRVEFFGCLPNCDYPIATKLLDVISYLDHDNYHRNVRENNVEDRDGASTPRKNDNLLFAHIKLGTNATVTQFAIRGSYSTKSNQQDVSVTLQYAPDSARLDWKSYKKNNEDMVFRSGETRSDAFVTHRLPYPIVAGHIRVLSRDFLIDTSVTLSVFGCPEGCRNPLGLTSGAIDSLHIASSSSKSSEYDGRHARLLVDSGGGSWIPASDDESESLRVDFGRQTTVSGVGTQGNAMIKCWVTEYILSYGDTGYDLVPVMDETSGSPKIFRGNWNNGEIVENPINPPIVARYIAIFPTGFNYMPCLRVEFYGCVLAV